MFAPCLLPVHVCNRNICVLQTTGTCFIQKIYVLNETSACVIDPFPSCLLTFCIVVFVYKELNYFICLFYYFFVCLRVELFYLLMKN
jgi:hypothetical protein